jgi:hypothetical protein
MVSAPRTTRLGFLLVDVTVGGGAFFYYALYPVAERLSDGGYRKR